ncbi:MAG: LSU ribosomal protein L9p [uncultured Chloroflexi bacterium]|uniref:Large ribosomal subunit protein bL9 n=1 Tax=uncultured Chloroflexota bacterium TaxID=166587 RepID=A0A6J4JKP8_9CHLR|nr:MAG: LSU ribosomal protein L9p [uncultured Chloroflexota bacterium]
MKVILLKDVDTLGRTGDVKDVAPGYARNFLLRRALATPATAGSLKQIDLLKQRRAKEDVRRMTETQSLAERIGQLQVTISARAGAEGRLFGSVTNSDVAAALKEQHGIEIDRRDVALDESIRTLGDHTVDIRFSGQVHAQLRVAVVDEAGAVAPAGAAAAATA